MAPGTVHYTYIKRATIPVIGFALGLFLVFPTWYDCWISLIFHFIVCRYIDPDLDAIGASDAEKRIRHELGICGAFIFGWWSTYAALMDWILRKGSHRSWLTHSIVPGTIIRVIWFDLPMVFPYLYLVEEVAIFSAYRGVIPQEILGHFLAFCIGDTIHLYLDNMIPFLKYKEKVNG